MFITLKLDEESIDLLRSIDISLRIVAGRVDNMPKFKSPTKPDHKATLDRLTISTNDYIVEQEVKDQLKSDGVVFDE